MLQPKLNDTSGTKVAFTSNSMTMDALFMCAHSSPSLSQRRHAASLMRRPKSEGLWPTLMASRLADAVLDREIEALKQYKYEASLQARHRLEGEPNIFPQEVGSEQISEKEAREGAEHIDDSYEKDSPHGLHRVRHMIMRLENGRRARMTLQTWGESVSGLPGQDSILKW